MTAQTDQDQLEQLNENFSSMLKKKSSTFFQPSGSRQSKSAHGGIVFHTSVRQELGADPVQENLKNINKKTSFSKRLILTRTQSLSKLEDVLKSKRTFRFKEVQSQFMKNSLTPGIIEQNESDSMAESQILTSQNVTRGRVQNDLKQTPKIHLPFGKIGAWKVQRQPMDEEKEVQISVLQSPKLHSQRDSTIGGDDTTQQQTIIDQHKDRKITIFEQENSINEQVLLQKEQVLNKLPQNIREFLKNTESISQILTKCKSYNHL